MTNQSAYGSVAKRLGKAFLVVSSLAGVLAAGTPQPCKQQLLLAYHRLTDLSKETSAVYHLQFVSTSHYLSPGQRNEREATVHGEMYCQGKRLYFHTEQMSLWQDGKYVATAQHAQRNVLLTRVVPGRAAIDPGRMLQMRDSLIQLGTLQQCVAEQRRGQRMQHIQLGYRGRVADRLSVKQLDFWLSPDNVLQEMQVQYRPGNTLRSLVMRFPRQEWLKTSANVPIDARLQVVDPQGQLLPAYQHYHLVNQIPAGR